MNSVLEERRLDVGGGLTNDEAEDALVEIPALGGGPAVSLTLDFSRCRHVEAGAGWRLGNALSRWARHGEVLATVPPPGNFSGSWFRTFTRSGLGLALAAFARQIDTSRDDVTDELRDYYATRGVTSATNHAIVAHLEDGAIVADLELFADSLEGWLNDVVPAGLNPESSDLSAIRTFAWEAITNIVDHAFAAPFEFDDGLSYFSLRFYKELDDKARGHTAAYVASVPASSAGRQRAGWIEMVVNDTGVGIAARHSQNSEIYRNAVDDEAEVLSDALQQSESVKLRARDAVVRGDPGYGYLHIQSSLAHLRAHAELRTGRLRAVLDGVAGNSEFGLADRKLGYLPGTALQILFPLYKEQLSLDL